MRALADAAQLSSLSDETPEGRSIVVLAKEKYGIRERQTQELEARFIPFTAQTRMSGVDLGANRQIRKGAVDAIEGYVRKAGGIFPDDLKSSIETISKGGGTPLVVAENKNVLGGHSIKGYCQGRH